MITKSCESNNASFDTMTEFFSLAQIQKMIRSLNYNERLALACVLNKKIPTFVNDQIEYTVSLISQLNDKDLYTLQENLRKANTKDKEEKKELEEKLKPDHFEINKTMKKSKRSLSLEKR